MDLQSLHRLKRKEVTASKGEPLTKCSFRDQGQGGWGGGGQLSSHPALVPQPSSAPAGEEPTAFLSLQLEYLGTQSCTNMEQHQAHRATWYALALPWLKTGLQDSGATIFWDYLSIYTAQIPPARQKLPSVPSAQRPVLFRGVR